MYSEPDLLRNVVCKSREFVFVKVLGLKRSCGTAICLAQTGQKQTRRKEPEK